MIDLIKFIQFVFCYIYTKLTRKNLQISTTLLVLNFLLKLDLQMLLFNL